MNSAPFSRNDLVTIALITGVVLVSYTTALSNGFVNDDLAQIVFNQKLRGWSNTYDIFTSGVWHSNKALGGIYRPIAFLTWLAEYSLFGLNPLVYHLTNVVLHFACSIMTYAVLKSILADWRTALISALIFAAHPVHTEAVAWISARMDLLYSLFVLAAFLLFIRKPHSPAYVALGCLLYMLGLLSKESAIVLPALILLYLLVFSEQQPARERIRNVSILLLPYLLTTLFYVLLRNNIIGFSGRVTGLTSNYEQFGGYTFFLTMCEALFEYIRLSFFPIGLRSEYVFMPPASMLDIKVLFAISSVVMSVVLSRTIWKRSRPAVFAIFWFFILLLPVSNIIHSGIIVAERALYLPSLGACLLIGLGISKAGETLSGSKLIYKSWYYAIPAVIVVVFTAGTMDRNRSWGHDEFYANQVNNIKRRIVVFPDDAFSYQTLGSVYLELRDYGPDAERTLKKAIELEPYNYLSHGYLSELYAYKNMPEDSLREVRIAISLHPEAVFYNQAAKQLQTLGMLDEAKRNIEEAIKLDKGVADNYITAADISMQMGEYREALILFNKATNLEPDNYYAHLGLGLTYYSMGDIEKAVENIRTAVDHRQDSPELRYYLAMALVEAGRPELAAPELTKALQLRPGYAEASELLANISH